MFSTRLAAALAVMGAIALTASTSGACPIGVQGIADPNSVVCAEDTSTGVLYCDVADASGNFNIIGGAVPPSTSSGCLPTGGTFTFYEVVCEQDGMFVDRDDPAQQYGGDWLDLRCRVDCGGGKCDHGSYTDGCQSYASTSPVSILMCQCDLLDPLCGVGSCSGGAYSTGASCATPVSYAPSSLVSQVMCDGATINPDTCTTEGCHPYSVDLTAGVCDAFSTANGAETPSPSAGLLTYISSVYSVSGSRAFDDPHANQWFGHTFTGLAPKNGSRICGAKLSATVGKGTELNSNDSLALMFVDGTGTRIGPSYGAALSSLTPSFTIDIGAVGGPAMLAQMENGWLDFIVQDDTAVDCLDLQIDYCCPCEPSTDSVTAGTCDAFASPSEAVSPSAGLGAYIAAVYPASGGSRDFDEITSDRVLGHTFSGLAPSNGAHICGAELTATIGKGVGKLANNDSLALMFVDGSGTPVGTSFSASLSSYGILNGSTATVSINVGAVGGPAMLAQMESGWLDFLVQDDTAVDCLSLKVAYCCKGNGTGGGAPPPTK